MLPLRNQTLSLSLRLKAEPRALPPEAHGGGTAVIHEDYLNPFDPGSFNSYDLLSLKSSLLYCNLLTSQILQSFIE